MSRRILPVWKVKKFRWNYSGQEFLTYFPKEYGMTPYSAGTDVLVGECYVED